MLFFVNDYCEGAHPAILQKLLKPIWRNFPAMAQTNTVILQKRRSVRPVAAGC